MVKQIFIVITIFLFPAISWATVIETDSTPTVVEVQALVDNASAGDTIKFMGDATWSGTVTIGKSLTINGNGKALTTGEALNGFFHITGFTANTTNPVRITGFTFTVPEYSSSEAPVAYAIIVSGMNGGIANGHIRIDNNTFYYGYTQIVFSHTKGLIDSNYFHNGYKSVNLTSIPRALADEAWEHLEAGVADALYIEDNHFIVTGALYGEQERIGTSAGGKLVVRHNEFDGDNTTTNFSPFMAHGNALGYWENDSNARRGQSVIEFYNNDIHGYDVPFMYTSRGSANLIFNNTHSQTKTTTHAQIYLYEEEFYIWGGMERTAWPAEDQVHNTFIWNNFSQDGTPIITSTDYNSYCTKSITPFACCSGEGTGTCNYGQDDALIKLNRDIFAHTPCGASDSTDAYGNTCTHGKETFAKNADCTNNLTPYKCCTGNGTGNCQNGGSETYPTDGNTYASKGQMIFTPTGDNAYLDYTPYTYPHPLRVQKFTGNVMIGGAGLFN